MSTLKNIIAASAFVAAGTTASFGATVNNAATGLVGAQNSVDFSEGSVARGTIIDTQFSGEGVTFSPKLTLLDERFSSLDGGYSNRENFDDEALFNFDSNFDFFNPFTINFDSVVTDATFAFTKGNNSGATTFTAILNGAMAVGVEQFSSDAGALNGFFGFTGIEFDEILVTTSGAQLGAAIDNLSFNTAPVAAVPLPAGLGLLLAAFGGLGIVGRRRKTA